ncbi:Asx homology domain-containing protein [Ganoderma leucocontextum]|nr:Asx homology domain-containing protein [Ganoderma leucocontextum]
MTDNNDGTSTRPRRSTRTPMKPSTKPAAVAPGHPTPESPVQAKRKARSTEAEKLAHLLTNTKSKLTKIDISDLINYNNFLELSEEAQEHLCTLLPPTAFATYVPSVSSSHPDGPPIQGHADAMDVDTPAMRNPATLDPTVLTSPFFLSAAHTWQDHLVSNWLGKRAADDLEKFRQGARDGTLHADWKDELWELDHSPDTSSRSKKKQTKADLDLTALVKRELLQVGDVLAYKRTFPHLKVTVEKDLLVDTINASSQTVNFLLLPGVQSALPPSLLVAGSREYDGKLLSIEDIADPVALERGVLDVDGRVSYADKYEDDTSSCPATHTQSGGVPEELRNAIAVRAWKSFTVWRWREEMQGQVEMQLVQERGARERVATLFYLRGCCTNAIDSDGLPAKTGHKLSASGVPKGRFDLYSILSCIVS